MLHDFLRSHLISYFSNTISGRPSYWETCVSCTASNGRIKHWSESLESLVIYPDQSQKLDPSMLQWVNRYGCTRGFMACRRATYRQFTAPPCFFAHMKEREVFLQLQVQRYMLEAGLWFLQAYSGIFLIRVCTLCLKINAIICIIFLLSFRDVYLWWKEEEGAQGILHLLLM
jgi:hypothetical protein